LNHGKRLKTQKTGKTAEAKSGKRTSKADSLRMIDMVRMTAEAKAFTADGADKGPFDGLI